MPKKGRKRLTTRKGTDIYGRSTRRPRAAPALDAEVITQGTAATQSTQGTIASQVSVVPDQRNSKSQQPSTSLQKDVVDRTAEELEKISLIKPKAAAVPEPQPSTSTMSSIPSTSGLNQKNARHIIHRRSSSSDDDEDFVEPLSKRPTIKPVVHSTEVPKATPVVPPVPQPNNSPVRIEKPNSPEDLDRIRVMTPSPEPLLLDRPLNDDNVPPPNPNVVNAINDFLPIVVVDEDHADILADPNVIAEFGDSDAEEDGYGGEDIVIISQDRPNNNNNNNQPQQQQAGHIENNDFIFNFNENVILQHNCGEMNGRCQSCHARYFYGELNTNEVYTKCCSLGQIRLDPLQEMPVVLRQLYLGEHEFSREFKKHIILYNNCFQFASIEANLRNIPGRGPFVYAIQGQIYHHYSDINVERVRQQFGPLYFLDPEEAARQRSANVNEYNNNLNVNENLIRLIGDIFQDVNPFAQQYRHLHDIYDEQQQDEQQPRLPNVCLELIGQRRNPRDREHDLPEVPDVAVIVDINDVEMQIPRMRVFLRNRDEGLRNINMQSQLCDPLTFPLLFPNGDLGWERNFFPRHGRDEEVTLQDYYQYRLADRYEPIPLNPDENENQNANNEIFDVFRYAGKLLQKFVVCAYLKIEASRLGYIMTHQNQLRVEEYNGLRDFVENQRDDNGENIPVGRLRILPSSFNLSPRSQMQRFQDALAVVSQTGLPSLFITMTCNPNWPEIVNNLPAGTQPADSPLLIARVFNVKLHAFIDDLKQNNLGFGRCKAFLYVIEFQKRGLPHAHCVLTLEDEDRLDTPEKIDRVICAELPDRNQFPRLFDLVVNHMIHGPCGVLNPQCVCMVDGRCIKKFPKYWLNQTRIRNGFCNYRRRQLARQIEVRKNGRLFMIDNSFVVPYNPKLLLKYQCHMNVEVCQTIGCIKYLYKYFFKGQDQALLRIVQQVGQNEQVQNVIIYDEITTYLNGRYMTPPEASWHLLALKMHASSHTVIRLPVHLERRQNVNFHPGDEQGALQRNRVTQLTAWFRLNREDIYARQFLYSEIPLHYVWKSRPKIWQNRQQFTRETIVRIVNVPIRSGELYYLRLLLLNVPAATSYEYLRTVEYVVYDTFQESCRQRGLLTEDREWFRSLTEAVERQMPKQLRQMFAFILIFGTVHDAPALWDQFHPHFIEDFVRFRGFAEEDAKNAALFYIQRILTVHGRNLAEFGLQQPPNEIGEIINLPQDVINERRIVNEMIQQLNPDQRAVFDTIVNSINENLGFFLKGAAGTGKTFLYNTLIGHFLLQEIGVLSVAGTGLAASLLKNGRTVHSMFGIPIPTLADSTSRIPMQSNEAQIIRQARLIIWDEISMATYQLLNVVDRTLRDLCNTPNQPFGGKCIIVGGDFKQCLPIVFNGDRTTIVANSVKNSAIWRSNFFQPMELQINMRVQPNEVAFAQWLTELGNGTLPTIENSPFKTIISNNCTIVNSIDELILGIFGENFNGEAPNKAILTPLNDHCHEINQQILNSIAGNNTNYDSIDSIIVDNPDDHVHEAPVEVLNRLTPSGFPLHTLSLKPRIIVMLLRNLNVRDNLCNGTRLLVRSLGQHIIELEKIDFNGQLTNQIVLLPRIDFDTATGNNNILPFHFRRRQFPLRVSYGITINKAQGQSFDSVGIYLPSPVFNHGQLYVAFSRARSQEQVFVCLYEAYDQGHGLDENDQRFSYTKNIVYREILAD